MTFVPSYPLANHLIHSCGGVAEEQELINAINGAGPSLPVSIANGGTGQTSAPFAINALLPSQTGLGGEFLTTNGMFVSWSALPGLAIGESVSGATDGCVLFVRFGVLAEDVGNFIYDVAGSNGFFSTPTTLYVGGANTNSSDGILCIFDSGDDKWMALSPQFGEWNFGAPGQSPGSTGGTVVCGGLIVNGRTQITGLTGAGSASNVLFRDSSGIVGSATLGTGLSFSGSTIVGSLTIGETVTGGAASQVLFQDISTSNLQSSSALQVIKGIVGATSYTGLQLNNGVAVPTDIGFTSAGGGAAVSLYTTSATGTIRLGDLANSSAAFASFSAGGTVLEHGSSGVQVFDSHGFGSGFNENANAWSGGDPNGNSFVFSDNTNAGNFTGSGGANILLCSSTFAISHTTGNIGFFNATPVSQRSGDIAAGLVALGFFSSANSAPGIAGNVRMTALTAAQSLTSYTVGASDTSFMVSCNINVTTSTVHNFKVTCTYTDETNTSRVLTMNLSQLTGAFVTAITNATGAGAYEGVPLHIRCKAATTITFATSGTFTTVTYNFEERIIQV